MSYAVIATMDVKQEYREALEQMNLKLKMKRYADSTLKTYVHMIKNFFRHTYPLPIELIDQDTILNYLKDIVFIQKVSSAYQNQSINAIKFYFERILGKPRIILQLERPRKNRKLPVVLSEEEVLGIFRSIKNFKHRLIIMLLYSSGIRRAELLNLKPGDIDLDRKELRVDGGKGLKDRTTVLSEVLIPDLRSYLEIYSPNKYLFEGQKGGMYSASSIRMILKRAVTASGIRKTVTLHTLRHNFATHLLEHGTPTRYIQEFLGHSSPITTEIYTRITDKGRKKIKSPLDQILNENSEKK